MTWWNRSNPSHCWCPRSRYDPRYQRPTHPDCPQHGEKTEAPLKTVALTTVLLAASLLAATPAEASSAKVDICHATGVDGKYVSQSVAKDGTADGHAGIKHQDARDIIPAFSWLKDGTRYYFEGQNLDKVGLIAKGCKTPATPGTVTINPPVYVPASCARPELPYGEVLIPADKGQGIDGHTVPALNTDNSAWSTEYALKASTEDATYAWPAGQTGQFSFNVVPLTADPLWILDSKTGVAGCELPDTGASDFLLPGLLGVGALAAGAFLRRRRGIQS